MTVKGLGEPGARATAPKRILNAELVFIPGGMGAQQKW